MNINIYNPYVRQELELYHHGILGQRWGKKNGPPYPLGASDHSASEKKAGWRKSLNKSSSDYANERDEVKALKKRLNRNEDAYFKNTREYNKQGIRGTRALMTGDAETIQDVANKQFLANANIQKAEQDTWKAIAKLVDKGYDVDMIPYEKMANKGEKIAATLLGAAGVGSTVIGTMTMNPVAIGTGAAGVLSSRSIIDNAEKIPVNRYEVRKNKDGKGHLYMTTPETGRVDSNFTTIDLKDKNSSNNNSPSNRSTKDKSSTNKTKTSNNATSKNDGSESIYTQKEMQKKIATARNKDQWDLEFLERYNPDDYYQEWNQADAIKEYKKYLKDPYKYHYEPPTATNNFKNLSYEKREAAKNNVRRMSSQKIGRARTMLNAGDSYAEIAKRLGVSESTIWALFSAEG